MLVINYIISISNVFNKTKTEFYLHPRRAGAVTTSFFGVFCILANRDEVLDVLREVVDVLSSDFTLLAAVDFLTVDFDDKAAKLSAVSLEFRRPLVLYATETSSTISY